MTNFYQWFHRLGRHQSFHRYLMSQPISSSPQHNNWRFTTVSKRQRLADNSNQHRKHFTHSEPEITSEQNFTGLVLLGLFTAGTIGYWWYRRAYPLYEKPQSLQTLWHQALPCSQMFETNSTMHAFHKRRLIIGEEQLEAMDKLVHLGYDPQTITDYIMASIQRYPLASDGRSGPDELCIHYTDYQQHSIPSQLLEACLHQYPQVPCHVLLGSFKLNDEGDEQNEQALTKLLRSVNYLVAQSGHPNVTLNLAGLQVGLAEATGPWVLSQFPGKKVNIEKLEAISFEEVQKFEALMQSGKPKEGVDWPDEVFIDNQHRSLSFAQIQNDEQPQSTQRP